MRRSSCPIPSGGASRAESSSPASCSRESSSASKLPLSVSIGHAPGFQSRALVARRGKLTVKPVPKAIRAFSQWPPRRRSATTSSAAAAQTWCQRRLTLPGIVYSTLVISSRRLDYESGNSCPLLGDHAPRRGGGRAFWRHGQRIGHDFAHRPADCGLDCAHGTRLRTAAEGMTVAVPTPIRRYFVRLGVSMSVYVAALRAGTYLVQHALIRGPILW